MVNCWVKVITSCYLLSGYLPLDRVSLNADWDQIIVVNLRCLLEFCGAKLKVQGPSAKVGNIVILKDHNVKKIFWKLAKVIELLHDSDEVVRAALANKKQTIQHVKTKH